MQKSLARLTTVLIASTMLAGVANAETIRWARSSDALTMDPHSQNQGNTHTVAHHIYETLLGRDNDGTLTPRLATEWGPDELMTDTGLKLPHLPNSWTVSDVQVYPSRHGPSVEIAAQTTEFGLISIFAAKPGPFLVMPPRTRDVEDTTTAYWQAGDMAYAIVATGHQDNVGAAAARLFELLR